MANLGSRITVGSAAFGSLLVFVWPLLISGANPSQTATAQGVFMALMPILVVMLLVEFGSGKLDAKRLAVLAVLIAMNSVIRLLGAGVSGIETAFVVIILGAYIFGSGFGYILGAGSLFVSALLGAGVGPWLPFQMMAAGLVGIGAGAIGRLKPTSGAERWLVSGYSVVASFGYGALMTMWNWPFLAGVGGSLSFVAGAPIAENLMTFIKYEIFTGGLLWDLGRALTTVALIALTGKALLATLRRAANKANFEAF